MALKKYLGDSKMFEYGKHYRECQQQNRPFIKAKTNPAHGNYFVQMDLMTCNYELSEQEQDQIAKLILDEIKYVQAKSKLPFNGFNIDKEVAWFDGVSSNHVETFCTSLYDLTQKYHS